MDRPTLVSDGRVLPLLLALLAGGAVFIVSCTGPTTPTAPVPAPVITCPPSPAASQSNTGQPIAVGYGVANSVGGVAPVTLSCVPASGSLFPVGTTTVTCTATDAKQQASSCSFAVTVSAPSRLSVTRFVAFGDSITAGEDGTSPATSALSFGKNHPYVLFPVSQQYPGALALDLAARYTLQSPTVDNKGQPGESVEDSTTFPRFVSSVANGPYDVVLLMEGTNDLYDNDPTVEPAVIAGLRHMIETAKGKGMRPYLATIPPMNPNGFRGAEYGWTLVTGLNDQIRALAGAESIPLVDVYQALNGDVPTFIGFDGLHPTVQGYAKIADTFFSAIRQTLELPPGSVVTPVSRGRTGSSATTAVTGQGLRASTPRAR